jgi:hypothetical protein
MFEGAMIWGAPYLLGRVYLGQPGALRDFAQALVVAGLVYVPFCLWEIRMSPQLHHRLYGFRSENFDTVFRFGGYRPSVFMQTGLAVAMFMAVTTLAAFWLWRTGALRRLWGVPAAWACALLSVTTILCKSTGAILLLAAGAVVLEGMVRLRTHALLLALALSPPAYCAARLAGWNGEQVVALAGDLVSDQRAGSLQFRVDNERMLIERAMVRPWLGWGRFGRSFVTNEEGQNQTVVDSLWIIVLGFQGLLGLISMGVVLAIPPLLVVRTWPARAWADPRLAPAAILAVSVLVWTLDDLLNAMISPLFPAMAGALVSFALVARAARARARPSRRLELPVARERSSPSAAT